MDLPIPDPHAVAAQARPMGRRFRRAAWLSFCFVALLAWIKLFEHWTSEPFSGLALRPHQFAGLVGVLTAPLLHGSLDHLASNSLPLLVLGTLAGTLYPRATLRALPLIWIGSGLGTWFIGEPGSAHIGASGLAHGFLFLVFLLGLIRRDRQAIAGSMLAFFLYGSMVITVFPREYGISWEMHMCGAICGLLAAILWRKLDPPLPRKRYSWEDEPEEPVLEEIPAPGHALPPGTAEEEWVENAIDAGLDWDEDLDDGRAPTRRRRTRPVRPRTLH